MKLLKWINLLLIIFILNRSGYTYKFNYNTNGFGIKQGLFRQSIEEKYNNKYSIAIPKIPYKDKIILSKPKYNNQVKININHKYIR